MTDQQQIPDPTAAALAHEAIRTCFATALLEAERVFQLAQAARDLAREQVDAWEATGQLTDAQVVTVYAWAADVAMSAGGRAVTGQGSRERWEAATLQLKAVDEYLTALGYDTSPEGMATLFVQNAQARRTPTPG